MTIDVLVVDDSAVVRQVLTAVLNEATDINVYATASDTIFAQKQMQKKWPEVILLDIEMPSMDGLTFLRRLMSEQPTPVIICSSLAEKGAELSLQALSAGAIDIITKPQLGVKDFLLDAKHLLWQTVRGAAGAHVARRAPSAAVTKPIPHAHAVDLLTITATTDSIILIGTST